MLSNNVSDNSSLAVFATLGAVAAGAAYYYFGGSSAKSSSSSAGPVANPTYDLAKAAAEKAGGGFPLVRKSWLAAVEKLPGKRDFKIFYDNMFAQKNHPELRNTYFGRSVFTGANSQPMNLAKTISTVCSLVAQDDMDTLTKALTTLGAKHCLWQGPPGPQLEAEYGIVADNVIQVLNLAVPEMMTPECTAEWKKLLGVAADVMINKGHRGPEGKVWLKKYYAKRSGELKQLFKRANVDNFAAYAQRVLAHAGKDGLGASDPAVIALAKVYESIDKCTENLDAFEAAAKDARSPLMAAGADGAKVADAMHHTLGNLSEYDKFSCKTYVDALAAALQK